MYMRKIVKKRIEKPLNIVDYERFSNDNCILTKLNSLRFINCKECYNYFKCVRTLFYNKNVKINIKIKNL